VVAAVELELPFTGRWLVENSPARRVPSHGTDLLATRYAIDFVGVDERYRTSPVVDLSTVLGSRRYREWLRGAGGPLERASGFPGERSVVEPWPVTRSPSGGGPGPRG
jgi:hypothetical protein